LRRARGGGARARGGRSGFGGGLGGRRGGGGRGGLGGLVVGRGRLFRVAQLHEGLHVVGESPGVFFGSPMLARVRVGGRGRRLPRGHRRAADARCNRAVQVGQLFTGADGAAREVGRKDADGISLERGGLGFAFLAFLALLRLLRVLAVFLDRRLVRVVDR